MLRSICFCILLAFVVPAVAQKPAIVPQPVSLQLTGGDFILDTSVYLSYNTADKDLKAAATLFAGEVKRVSGVDLLKAKKNGKKISLQFASLGEIGSEGYLLSVNASGISLSANSREGILHGMQSLLQCMPAIRTNETVIVPCMQVNDYPQFAWRGLHLDVSRHFFSAEFVKEYIDLIARYKMNTLHWHLVDDPGWRIEIKKYPKLTQTGAWRVDQNDKPWGDRPQAKPGEQPNYGGFYTQEQVKDIVAYATARGVNIVPEIEMPGHVASAITSYPELSCKQLPQVALNGGNYENICSVYCAGNDSVFRFLQDVLAEVMALFPSKYIHVGGDEVDKGFWKTCPKCQARIKAEGLHNEEELQSYFIKRIEKYIVSKGRKLIGWDEILEGGLAPEATVMSWRGEAGGIQAAKMHHDVVMTPGYPLYFDHYQADPETEPLAFGGFNSLKNVYDYQPVPAELTADESKYVLGAQANLWTEMIVTPKHAEYMVLPRMLALSEVLWSPKTTRNWEDFYARIKKHFKQFDQLGYSYSKGNLKVNIQPQTSLGKLGVALSNEVPGSQVFYTLDGTEPTAKSILYQSPVSITNTSTLKAVTVIDGNAVGKTNTQSFNFHKAIGYNVQYREAPSKYYMADGINTLTDGIRGGLSHGKFWHGFEGKDVVVVVDLIKPQTIQSLSLGCLQRYKDWIFMPQSVSFEVSTDGNVYTPLATVSNTISQTDKEPVTKDFTTRFALQNVRFIRVTAKAIDAIPKGHPGEGKKGWIFLDELVAE